MNIGYAIKTLRKKNGLKQYVAAKQLRISTTYLSLIESGHKEPSMAMMDEIATLYKVPLAIIFWFTLDIREIPKNKQLIFKELKPSIDRLINEIF